MPNETIAQKAARSWQVILKAYLRRLREGKEGKVKLEAEIYY